MTTIVGVVLHLWLVTPFVWLTQEHNRELKR